MTKQIVTPWVVEAKCEDGKMAVIDYDHIITQFGCSKFGETLLKEFESLTGASSHRFLRRNLVFAHRGFEKILDCAKSKKPFYLYTGRGPSSSSMHIGHSVPFILCKYLQDAFEVPIVIQMTDDEKFLCKNISIEETHKNCFENIKDIIAYGFKLEHTYIFSNYESSHLFFKNTLKISKLINLNEAMKVFGFDINTNIGMVEFPAREIAAAYSSSFRFLPEKAPCLIPCSVDQDPYFRLARDKAYGMGEEKPSTIYVSMLPDLQGTNKKMSASNTKSTIYLSDTPNEIKNKINRLAFSGGKETLEEHRALGGDPTVDVPFQYLRFFLEDDRELEDLRSRYVRGELTTGEMKKRCIEVLQAFISEYQQRRREVTDDLVAQYMDISRFMKKE
ncbi:tryptophanyl-tRNA synthetase [Pancytospora epiphaga]|nr:tryptophanyl-tRNA synthetase [Pancytospora epiphaga]